jgi:hypothetical protein
MKSGWVVRGEGGHYLTDVARGSAFQPGILGAATFEYRDEADLYAERVNAGRAPIAEVFANPFHRCADCRCVSRDTTCATCRGA